MSRLCRLALLVPLAVFAAAETVPQPPPDFGTVDQTVVITTVPTKMAYDTTVFTVKPGANVMLTLVNPDDMQHNLVLCRPGKEIHLEVGQAALSLGAEAISKEFVPDHPAVLHHTPLVDPHQSATIFFKAPSQPGNYPFVCTLPGHAALMNGVMKVGAQPRRPELLTDIAFRYYRTLARSTDELKDVTPTLVGTQRGKAFNLEPVRWPGASAILFTGTLTLPADGEYRFELATEGRAALLLDGEQIVEGTPGGRIATAMLPAGKHAVELHYFSEGPTRDLTLTLQGPGLARTALTIAPPPMQLVTIGDRPQAVRVALPDTSPASIAVGLPGGFNYCFDIDKGTARYAWRGFFLNVAPNTEGRGGKVCEPLETTIPLGAVDFPLRIGANNQPTYRFLEYRITTHVSFVYSVDGIEVIQTVEPSPETPDAIQFTFQLHNPTQPIRFHVNPKHLRIAASAGTWREGVLTVPAADAARFTVTLVPEPPAPQHSHPAHP